MNQHDSPDEMRDFLEEKVRQYNRPDFIRDDPIQVPHMFSRSENIEIAGFLTACIAWGRRDTIIASARRLIGLMDNDPADFLSNAREKDFRVFKDFRHRTFSGIDCAYFMRSMASIYRNHGGLGRIFEDGYTRWKSVDQCLVHFRNVFFSVGEPGRTSRHIPDIRKNSAAKRMNMFLRWMVRRDSKGVDFGLWNSIPLSALLIPLDVHTGTVARKLGLLSRRADDWKAVQELTEVLRGFDASDPVKYDYALFGLGACEDF